MVDESMLSGESVPVSKMPSVSAPDMAPSGPNIVYAGTKLVSMEGPLTVRIRATGSMTLRAKMLLVVAYPRAMSFVFNQDYEKLCVGTLLVILFLLITTWILSQPTFALVDGTVFLRLFEVLAMLIRVSQSFQYILWIAQTFLYKQGIECKIQGRLLPASAVNVAAFDKTGTLTSSSMVLEESIAGSKFAELSSGKTPTVDQLATEARR